MTPDAANFRIIDPVEISVLLESAPQAGHSLGVYVVVDDIIRQPRILFADTRQPGETVSLGNAVRKQLGFFLIEEGYTRNGYTPWFSDALNDRADLLFLEDPGTWRARLKRDPLNNFYWEDRYTGHRIAPARPASIYSRCPVLVTAGRDGSMHRVLGGVTHGLGNHAAGRPLNPANAPAPAMELDETRTRVRMTFPLSRKEAITLLADIGPMNASQLTAPRRTKRSPPRVQGADPIKTGISGLPVLAVRGRDIAPHRIICTATVGHMELGPRRSSLTVPFISSPPVLQGPAGLNTGWVDLVMEEEPAAFLNVVDTLTWRYGHSHFPAAEH